jgi:hypothetical protein
MRVLGIDPGPSESAWVVWDGGKIWGHHALPNADMAEVLREEVKYGPQFLAIERPQAYGGRCPPVLLDTAIQAGMLMASWPDPTTRLWITYGEVSQHHTGRRGNPESAVRAALIERIGPVGTKAKPGPLWGLRVKDHHFSALAVAVCAADRLEAQHGRKTPGPSPSATSASSGGTGEPRASEALSGAEDHRTQKYNP